MPRGQRKDPVVDALGASLGSLFSAMINHAVMLQSEDDAIGVIDWLISSLQEQRVYLAALSNQYGPGRPVEPEPDKRDDSGEGDTPNADSGWRKSSSVVRVPDSSGDSGLAEPTIGGDAPDTAKT